MYVYLSKLVNAIALKQAVFLLPSMQRKNSCVLHAFVRDVVARVGCYFSDGSYISSPVRIWHWNLLTKIHLKWPHDWAIVRAHLCVPCACVRTHSVRPFSRMVGVDSGLEIPPSNIVRLLLIFRTRSIQYQTQQLSFDFPHHIEINLHICERVRWRRPMGRCSCRFVVSILSSMKFNHVTISGIIAIQL